MNFQFGIASEHWRKILSLFAKQKNISEVVLFGSRAMKSFKEGSDIDLALKGNHLTLSDLNAISLDYDNLYLPWKLDLILWDQISNQDLKDHIERVGVVVFPSI